jgi:hypothetical protein
MRQQGQFSTRKGRSRKGQQQKGSSGKAERGKAAVERKRRKAAQERQLEERDPERKAKRSAIFDAARRCWRMPRDVSAPSKTIFGLLIC